MAQAFNCLNKNNVCIHHDDDDGFGAAWVCREYLIDGLRQGFGAQGHVSNENIGCEFIATNYGMPTPSDLAGKNVAIVDFSYNRDVMRSICQEASSVLVLDHHKTAEQELAGLEGEFDSSKNITIKFEIGKSGVLMAWEHFYANGQAPELIGYLDAGDLWQLDRYDDLKQVQSALRSYPRDFEQWSRWMTPEGLAQLRSDGAGIRRFIERKVEELLKTRHKIEIDGRKVDAVNAPYFLASEIAWWLAEWSDDGWAACYYTNHETTSVSLRSRGSVDVSEIAKKYGGGGHKNAAGFRMPRI